MQHKVDMRTVHNGSHNIKCVLPTRMTVKYGKRKNHVCFTLIFFEENVTGRFVFMSWILACALAHFLIPLDFIICSFLCVDFFCACVCHSLVVESGRLFIGNKDQNSVNVNTFAHPLHARYVRVCPQEWNQHISMRWDLYYV